MKRFFFDLSGEVSAKDVHGRLCSSQREAREHAAFIAQRIGTERPEFVRLGNCIKVRGERGEVVFTAPIITTQRAQQTLKERTAARPRSDC